MPITIRRSMKRRKTDERRKKLGTDTEFRRLAEIHAGSEAMVRRVNAHVTKNGRTRLKPVELVEKKFYGKEETAKRVSYTVYKQNPMLANPVEQFEFVLKLRRLNTRRHLGLRFPRTIRLVKNNDGTYSILMTPLNVVNPLELEPTKEEAYYRDRERQQTTLVQLRIRALGDVFYCVQDPATGEVSAVIGDFGTLSYIKKK